MKVISGVQVREARNNVAYVYSYLLARYSVRPGEQPKPFMSFPPV